MTGGRGNRGRHGGRGQAVVSDASTDLKGGRAGADAGGATSGGVFERRVAVSLSYNPTPSTEQGFTAACRDRGAVRRGTQRRRCCSDLDGASVQGAASGLSVNIAQERQS